MVTSWKCALICCYLLEICLVNDRNLCLDGWMYGGEGSIFSLWYCIVCYYLYTYIWPNRIFPYTTNNECIWKCGCVCVAIYFWFNINERVPQLLTVLQQSFQSELWEYQHVCTFFSFCDIMNILKIFFWVT